MSPRVWYLQLSDGVLWRLWLSSFSFHELLCNSLDHWPLNPQFLHRTVSWKQNWCLSVTSMWLEQGLWGPFCCHICPHKNIPAHQIILESMDELWKIAAGASSSCWVLLKGSQREQTSQPPEPETYTTPSVSRAGSSKVSGVHICQQDGQIN